MRRHLIRVAPHIAADYLLSQAARERDRRRASSDFESGDASGVLYLFVVVLLLNILMHSSPTHCCLEGEKRSWDISFSLHRFSFLIKIPRTKAGY